MSIQTQVPFYQHTDVSCHLLPTGLAESHGQGPQALPGRPSLDCEDSPEREAPGCLSTDSQKPKHFVLKTFLTQWQPREIRWEERFLDAEQIRLRAANGLPRRKAQWQAAIFL